MRVLIVEDDDPTLYSIAEALRKSGIEDLASVWSGRDAVTYSHPRQGFDVMTLDLTLPDMDGHGVIKTIRNDGHRIPILVLTEDASIESKVKALDLGADDYMTKPFHKDELVARLKAIYRGRQIGYEAAFDALQACRTKVA